MITYVNTVFVSNNTSANTPLTSLAAIKTENQALQNKGRFVLYDVDNGKYSITEDTTRFKIGMLTGAVNKDHKGEIHPVIKWSNIINVADIKSKATMKAPAEVDTEDTIVLDFTELDSNVADLFKEGGKRIIVRLTFKDLPTRFRKWTESYEYVTKAGDDAAKIAEGIANMITKQWKRARVTATANGSKVTLVAMPYDDDNSVDTINWYNKVRFNANLYYTDPAADGWESLNKHYPTGVTIVKTPGSTYPAAAKLVRDREAQAMGYEGILNRGEGTWPIIKPAMETKLENKYNALTLEFENMYRAADDIFRKTKQTVEIYGVADITGLLDSLSVNNQRVINDKEVEHDTVKNPKA